jgi:hypothetical protein
MLIKKGLLFLKKKKQKDFDSSGAGMFEHQWPRLIKVFWFFFSKKELLPHSLNKKGRRNAGLS